MTRTGIRPGRAIATPVGALTIALTLIVLGSTVSEGVEPGVNTCVTTEIPEGKVRTRLVVGGSVTGTSIALGAAIATPPGAPTDVIAPGVPGKPTIIPTIPFTTTGTLIVLGWTVVWPAKTGR